MNTRKLLCPWERIIKVKNEEQWSRASIEGYIDFIVYNQFKKGLMIGWRAYIGSPLFSTKEAAMEHLDKILIKEGYTFLTADQAEKYRLLL